MSRTLWLLLSTSPGKLSQNLVYMDPVASKCVKTSEWDKVTEAPDHLNPPNGLSV